MKCELEQEVGLSCKTIETLRKSCELGDEQRNKKQKETEHMREKIICLEEEISTMKMQEEESKVKYACAIKKLESCETQRNRLQKEMILLQKRICAAEPHGHANSNIEELKIKTSSEVSHKEEKMFSIDETIPQNVKQGDEVIEGRLAQSFNDFKDATHRDVDIYYLKTLNEKLSDELKTLLASIDLMKNSLSERDQRIDILSNQKRQCEVQFNVVVEELNDLKEAVNLYEKNIAQLNEEKLQLTKESFKNGASLKELKIEFEKKLNSISELNENLAQKDKLVKDLITEVSQKEILISDLQEKINKNNETFDEEQRFKESQIHELQYKLERKELIVDELEACVENLQQDFETLGEDQSKSLIQELHKELDAKNLEIYDLEIHCRNLRELVDSQQENIEKLTLHIQLYKENEIRQEQEPTQNAVNLESVINANNLCFHNTAIKPKLPLLNAISYKGGENNDSFHQESKSSSFEISSDTRDDVLIENASSNIHLKKDFLNNTIAIFNIKSDQDDHPLNEQCSSERIVSRKDHLDLLEALRQKDFFILELQESIRKLEKDSTLNDSGNFFDNTSDSDIMGRKTKTYSSSSALMELKLPQPGSLSLVQNSSRMESASRNRATSLPTTPVPFKPPPGPSLNLSGPINGWAEERKKFELEKKELVNKFSNEIRLTKERSLKMEAGAEDLRTEIVRLNSEVLNKKIEVRKLEDDLKLAQRKQERAEESYR